MKFIASRIMICASEDVGNADPMALTVAVQCSTGSGADRNAGGTDHFITGSVFMWQQRRRVIQHVNAVFAAMVQCDRI